MNPINTAIVEKILGWELLDQASGLYCRPGPADQGYLENCPDFVALPEANQALREAMASRGFTLTITPNPVDWEKNVGRTFTARFTRGNESFEETQPDENLAVCLAALKANRLQITATP